MLFETQIGRHRIAIDGPREWGGQDRGPMPAQLLMAALGSCVAVLATDFCRTHELNSDGMQVEVTYDVATRPTRYENITVKLNLPNAQCDSELTTAALEYVAKHCPVYETIMTLEKVMFEIQTA